MKNQLIKYIRNPKTREPRGVVVAFNENGKVHIGWSLCSKEDKWDKDLGFKIAVNRAYFHAENELLGYKVAQSAYPDFRKMVERSKKFFKEAAIPECLRWLP